MSKRYGLIIGSPEWVKVKEEEDDMEKKAYQKGYRAGMKRGIWKASLEFDTREQLKNKY